MRLFFSFLLLAATALGGKLKNVVNGNVDIANYSTVWGDIYGATDAPVFFPTTAESTTTSTPFVPTTTSTPLVTTTSNTATSSPQTKQRLCSCDWGSAWVDVVVVLDASSASGQDNLNEMWVVAGTALQWLTLTNTTDPVTTNYTSRLGIVTYGNTATVYRPLGSVNSNDLYNILSIPSNNADVTNLEAGIQAAAAELSGPAHRRNAKKVMIVFATTFNLLGSNPPQEAALEFISDGGILMVYNHVPAHGTQTVDPNLKNISSPGYFFTNFNTSFVPTDLDDAICDANCFCPTYYYSFTNSLRNMPTGGCYQGVNDPGNYRLASNKCTLSNNGSLAFDESSAKTVFLGQQFQNKPTNFWIGVIWNNDSWVWADGTPLGPYQPWLGGSTPAGGGTIINVYVNTNNQWVATDWRNGFVYACETSPCDSLHYCP